VKITHIETLELPEGTAVHAGTIGWLWVRVYSDEGPVGLGETYPATASEKAVVLKDFAPLLVGREPRPGRRVRARALILASGREKLVPDRPLRA
jgi:L-alanine-DL-glutamate epimerase-like enolase superfamily enzyme